MGNYPELFAEQLLGPYKLKNRFIVSPMTRISADEDGMANSRMERYYKRYAKGGFAAVISEGIYTDGRYSQGYLNQPGLVSAGHIASWRPITETVQDHGALIIAQLMHAGGQSQGNIHSKQTAAPSAIAPKGEQLEFYGGSGPYAVPKEMSEQDITEVKRGFAAAAMNARQAGFNGVEIHGANGYLLDQFLTASLNEREDSYGGSLQNRMRLLMEIIYDVQQAAGNDMIIGIRISQAKVSDSNYKWPHGEKDAEAIFSLLGKTPLDYIHVTDANGTASSFGDGTKSLAAAAKEYSGLPVIANGQLQDPRKASSLISSGEADFVSLGTGALANPDAPKKISKGKDLEAFNPEEILMPLANIKDLEL
ncbi:NADH:flavin oxidoreductase [Metabacillus sp. KIGAM252]|uniref:NADH:flavin oxidoreductase n=1 Tax=Metabacillus flavus TaxID=2823519 RepID=A0ABS5LIQ3_9BACI|nr:NADH:flavin oxidoreductase [Metabacillus flavus]MBS2970597.1 NADH:flavin oxidoreductase [Metabacillus flavus]